MANPLNIPRRIVALVRNWQDPCWDFQPLREMPMRYRVFVVAGFPLLALQGLLTAWLVGVEPVIHSWPLVLTVMVLTAVMSTIIFKADFQVAAVPADALPLALLLAGEPLGATLVMVVSMLAYGFRVPMPLHVTWSINVLGCGVWLMANTAALFHVLSAGTQVGSAAWFGVALVALVAHSLGCFVPVLLTEVLGEQRGFGDAVRSQLESTRTEMATQAAFIMLAAVVMVDGPWWTALFGAAPLLVVWETYHRTTQYVQARSDAEHDALTGLLNRRALEVQLNELLVEDRPEPLWVMLCDLDNFKQLNDVHGHHIGDAALVKAAAAMRESVRASDIAARFGGEEFVVVLRGVDERQAAVIAERLRQRGKDGIGGYGSSVSIGLYAVGQGDGMELALQRADQAMYHSKRTGKDRVTFWTQELDGFDYDSVDAQAA